VTYDYDGGFSWCLYHQLNIVRYSRTVEKMKRQQQQSQSTRPQKQKPSDHHEEEFDAMQLVEKPKETGVAIDDVEVVDADGHVL